MSEISPRSVHLIDERISWLDREMDAVLGSASPDLDLYRWARYHIGWLDESLSSLGDAERRRHGGKRLRGVLTILSCEAVGGAGQAAAAAGAAIEFIHNFSLVHDDVEDNDEERRHRRTVWKLWGIPHAINVGSSMQAMVDLAVLRLSNHHPPEKVVRALHVTSRAIVLMTEGQYLDMAAQDAVELSLAGYFRMTGGKTAALIEAGLRAGALLGTADEARIEAMAQFGRQFGLAFQCRDDFLGVWGEPSVTGKPVGSDIIQGKRSLPVVHALVTAGPDTPDGRRLREALAARDVPSALALFERLGTASFCTARAAEQTSAALAALDRAGVSGEQGEAVREIAAYALGRES